MSDKDSGQTPENTKAKGGKVVVRAVKGTRDLLPEDTRKFRYLREHFNQVVELYGFGEIDTPILESIDVFTHSLGDTSDVVTKQMYAFKDNNGDTLVLRPEGTAGVARAFINEGLAQETPLKLSYFGPMFRYERPQKGRYRQFSQMGVEILGVQSALADVECIACADQLLKTIGVGGRYQLLINSIGDAESRSQYRTRLTSYLQKHVGDLSADSRNRLEKNPLRILDSKDEGDRKILKDAPLFRESLNEVSQKFFAEVCSGLGELGISFEVDDALVRGFDYYCHSVFEFVTSDLGSQNAILSGGRYDGLVESLGGPKTPGIGWAAGVDRIALMLNEGIAARKPISIIPMQDECVPLALQACSQLRSKGIAADMGYSGNIGKRMKRADKLKSEIVIMIGGDELKRGNYILKKLSDSSQSEFLKDKLLETVGQL